VAFLRKITGNSTGSYSTAWETDTDMLKYLADQTQIPHWRAAQSALLRYQGGNGDYRHRKAWNFAKAEALIILKLRRDSLEIFDPTDHELERFEDPHDCIQRKLRTLEEFDSITLGGHMTLMVARKWNRR
jgi:hypothetical protein